LVIGDRVLVGLGGGDTEEAGAGIRGAVVALDTKTGAEIWRFHTVPSPGEKGNDTWADDSWKTGGAGVWVTGSYDPDLGLTFWGTGNPSPPFEPTGTARAGDNLFSASVVALDAASGALRWHYQFTPHDEMDWDAAQVPVLVDMPWQGRERRLMLFANKNGLVYVLDRATGEFLAGTPYVNVNWMSGFDGKGRPRLTNSDSVRVSPTGATNWYPASYSPKTGLLYIPAWNRVRERYGFTARGPAQGSIVAFDPRTSKKAWEYTLDGALFTGGVLTTASDVLFTGTSMDFFSDRQDARRFDGLVLALHARTGQQLWTLGLPGPIQGPPITYSVDGKQYVVLSTNDTLFALSLR
jgi:alcohol dehydrogenase (cytochrome c)